MFYRYTSYTAKSLDQFRQLVRRDYYLHIGYEVECFMCTEKIQYVHSAPLGFSTQTKSSEDETSFGTCYDVKEARISQEKHLSSGFPLNYHLNSAGRAAHVGRLAGTV